MQNEVRPFLNIGPGDFISEELEYRGWQQADLAEIIGMSKKSINAIIKNTQSISIDTARLLGKVFGQSPQYWINLDTNYRLRITESTERESEAAEKSLIYNYMPIKEMVRRGWIAATESTTELASEVCSFWNIPQLDLSFIDELALPNFRKSDAYGKQNEYHALTWLQMAKNNSKTNLNPYSSKKLSAIASDITRYSSKEDGISLFLNALNEAGINFSILRHLPQTYTDGASFLNGETPTIVYTCRYNRINHFWFTIAHEIGHVINHLKNSGDFIVDDSENIETDDEKTADEFASSVLKEREILDYFSAFNKRVTTRDVIVASTVLKIGEAIIVGTLQHNNRLPWTHLNGFTSNVSKSLLKKYWIDQRV